MSGASSYDDFWCVNPDVCFNAWIVNNSSSCISPRISDQSSAIYSDSLHTDNNWNNLTAWKCQFILFSIWSNVTGQHDRQGEKFTIQLPNQSGRCALTGHYLESCEPLVSLTEEKKGITKTKWKELIILFSKNIFGFFCNYLNCIYQCNDHIVIWNYLFSWKKIYSLFSHDVTKIQTKKLPIFMRYYSTQTPLFIQIFSSKGSFVLR